jgi:hypothetical protein
MKTLNGAKICKGENLRIVIKNDLHVKIYIKCGNFRLLINFRIFGALPLTRFLAEVPGPCSGAKLGDDHFR